MKGLRWGLWLGLVAMMGSRAMEAQKVYAARGPGSNIVVGGGVSLFEDDYGQRRLGGLVTYVDLNATWRYGLEAEARTLRYRSSEDVTQSNYLVGPKVALWHGNVRPYAKALIGVGKMSFPFHYAQGSYLVYAMGGGVDWLVGDRLIVKVVDYEYQAWPQFNFGGLTPSGLTVGVAVRLNGLRRIPVR